MDSVVLQIHSNSTTSIVVLIYHVLSDDYSSLHLKKCNGVQKGARTVRRPWASTSAGIQRVNFRKQM